MFFHKASTDGTPMPYLCSTAFFARAVLRPVSRKLDRQGDEDLGHVVQHVQDGVAVRAVVFPEGEHDQHIVARREAHAADEEQKQRPARADERARRRAGRHKQHARDIHRAERRDLPGPHLLGVGVEAGRAERHDGNGDRVCPRLRAERQDRRDIHHVPQEKRDRARREEEMMQLLPQIPQRHQQIAQHPERQPGDDQLAVHARPRAPQLQKPQQHEHERSRRLEKYRHPIASAVGPHDKKRLQYRPRTDQQDPQHTPAPFPFLFSILPCRRPPCQFSATPAFPYEGKVARRSRDG